MKGSWRRHFDKSNLSLDHPDPDRFVRGPWHSGLGPPVHPLFLMYRIALTMTFTGLLIWSIALNFDEGKWLLYLTNWGFVACTLQTYFGSAIVLMKFLNRNVPSPASSTSDLKSDTERMPLSYRMYWMFYNVGVGAAFFVTILYWTILYIPEHDNDLGGFGLNFSVHALNSILTFVDFVVGGPPSRLLHAYQPIIFAVFYISTNLIYWAAGGKGRNDTDYIYPVLDWNNKPGLGVGIIFGGAALLIILQCFICFMAGIRSKLTKKTRSHVLQNLGNIPPPPLRGDGNVNKAFVI